MSKIKSIKLCEQLLYSMWADMFGGLSLTNSKENLFNGQQTANSKRAKGKSPEGSSKQTQKRNETKRT